MADHEILMQFVDNDAISYLERLASVSEDAGRKMVTAQKSSTDALKGAAKATEDLSKADQELEATAKKAKSAMDNQKKSAEELGKGIHELTGDIEFLGVNLSQSIRNLQEYRTKMIAATKAVDGKTKAMKALRIAFISTGIGALLVALTSLATYFTHTQRGATQLKRFMDQLAVAVNTLKDYLSAMGEVLVKTFSNPKKLLTDFGNLIKDQIVNRFMGALEILGAFGRGLQALITADLPGMKKAAEDAFSGFEKYITGTEDGFKKINDGIKNTIDGAKEFGKTMKENWKEAGELADMENAMHEKRRQLMRDETELQRRINELREEANRGDQPVERQIELLEEAYRLQDQLAARQEEIAADEFEIYKRKNAINESLHADMDEEVRLETEIGRIQSQRAAASVRLISRIRGLRAQATAEQKAAYDQRIKELEAEQQKMQELENVFKDLYSTIRSEMHSLEREFMTPGQLIADDERIALESIETLFAETARAYKEAYGEELDVTEQMEEAKMLVRRKYAEQRKKLEEGMAEDIRNAELKELDEMMKNLEKETELTFEDLGDFLDLETFFPENFVQEIQQRLKEAYDLDDQDLASIAHSLGSIFTTFSTVFGEGVQRQLDENQRLIDAIQERKDEAKAALDEEIDAMEAGYASDVESRESYYNSIIEQEQELERERAQLLERQRRQQIAQESAQQAAAIGTAVANFMASGAKFGPVVGLSLAATAIAGMFSIIRAAKSQTQDVVKMHEGGALDLHSGFVKKHGRNDKYQKGYRIEGTNKEVGGNEFIIRQSLALKDQEFLEAYNSGRLNWIDLNQLARGNIGQFESVTTVVPDVRKQSSQLAGRRISMRDEVRSALLDVMPGLLDKTSVEITGSINRRKEYFEMDGDIFEYSQGKMKRIRNFG